LGTSLCYLALRGRTIILDEIHRLQNPSEFLKIAADHYPEVRILAISNYLSVPLLNAGGM